MRARYYSPEMRRFINADIVPGEISDAVTLNRFAYANGNPVSNIDPFGLCIEKRNLEAYNQYGELIRKSLLKAKESIHRYYMHNRDLFGREMAFNKAYAQILDSLENGRNPEAFNQHAKIRIEIYPRYLMSGDELLLEFGGFIPVLGELIAIVTYFSEEEKNYDHLLDAAISAVTEGDISKLTPIAEELDTLGKVADVIGVLNVIETFINFTSEEKMGTKVRVFFDTYMYEAVIDREMRFTEMYASFTGNVFTSNDSHFEIRVK